MDAEQVDGDHLCCLRGVNLVSGLDAVHQRQRCDELVLVQPPLLRFCTPVARLAQYFKLPQKGRGHRFASCRVRQSPTVAFALLCDGGRWAIALQIVAMPRHVFDHEPD